MAPEFPTVSASELQEYAFCPRAHWYSLHPPAEGPSRDSVHRSDRGRRFHAHALRATRRRAEHAVAYWVLVGAGVLAVVGGLLWLLS